MSGLSELSERRLKGVHPELQAVVRRAVEIADAEILVVEGLRTVTRQKALVAGGKSTTMNSRHITGHAVDLCAIVDGKLAWGKPHSQSVADAVKQAAVERQVDIDWGGDWRSFVDTPHFQLDWGAYPKQDESWRLAPAPAPKQEVAAAMAKSTKATVASRSKVSLLGAGGITAGWPLIKEQINVSSEILQTAQQVIATNGLLFVSGACIILAIVFNWFQIKAADDYKEGRYTPSGQAQ